MTFLFVFFNLNNILDITLLSSNIHKFIFLIIKLFDAMSVACLQVVSWRVNLVLFINASIVFLFRPY